MKGLRIFYKCHFFFRQQSFFGLELLKMDSNFSINPIFTIKTMQRMMRLKTTCALFLVLFMISGQANSQQGDPVPGDLIRPPYLKKGDTILILSPAGRVGDRKRIDPATELANRWGLVVFYGNHLLSQEGTFAGADHERLEDLQKGLDDRSIKAIWASRGGYGTIRIIDELDFSEFVAHPKWIIGFSDITVLHNKMHKLGIQTIHGQMPLTLKPENPEQDKSIRSLHRALFGKKLEYRIESVDSNRMGEGRGQLVGGNLSIVYSMLGSDTDIDMRGKVLFIEDVGEALYRIDRMMISLKRAGYFKQCKGLIVGDFGLKENSGNEFGKTLEEIVMEAVAEYDFPVVFDFPAGHTDDNRSLILGSYVDVKAGPRKSKISFR